MPKQNKNIEDKKPEGPSEETQRRYNKRRVARGKAPILLREWASSRAISHAVLADTLGVSRASMTLYMQGAVIPNLENAAKLYKATGGMVDFTDWFDAEELNEYAAMEFEQRPIGRPPKEEESDKVAKARKKQRKERQRLMNKNQKKRATEEQRKLDAT